MNTQPQPLTRRTPELTPRLAALAVESRGLTTTSQRTVTPSPSWAVPGRGKGAITKSRHVRALTRQWPVVVVDPQRGYDALVDQLGGTALNLNDRDEVMGWHRPIDFLLGGTRA